MRDPLYKRIPRVMRDDLAKQLLVFLFFVLIIGAGSGFFVSGKSLLKEYNDAFDKYNIEDGNFELFEKAGSDVISDIEDDAGISVYENFYKQEETKGFESKLRIYADRKEIDKVCLLSGSMPSADDEIAIDRLYAENHKLGEGDKIELDDTTLTVTGYAALSDYSTLYEKSSDLMFDNDKFGVGIMTADGFDSLLRRT